MNTTKKELPDSVTCGSVDDTVVTAVVVREDWTKLLIELLVVEEEEDEMAELPPEVVLGDSVIAVSE